MSSNSNDMDRRVIACRMQMVTMGELTDEFQQGPSPEEKRTMAERFGIPLEHAVHEIVFSVPAGSAGDAYVRFSEQHIQQHGKGEGAETYIQARTMPVREFLEVYGMAGLRDFVRSMQRNGHPYQPVRVFRDARIPLTLELESNAVYRSEP